jgi:hypothetical protein
VKNNVFRSFIVANIIKKQQDVKERLSHRELRHIDNWGDKLIKTESFG